MAKRKTTTRVPLPPPHPDAELLAACARFALLQAECRRLYALPGDVEHEPEGIYDEMMAISNLPARTLEGLKSKADAILDFWNSLGGRSHTDLCCSHERLEYSLVLDVAGKHCIDTLEGKGGQLA